MDARVVLPVAVVVPTVVVVVVVHVSLKLRRRDSGGATVPSATSPPPLVFSPSLRRTYEGEWLCDRPEIKETNQG